MSKYYLKADYDIQSLKFRKTEDTIVVDIPMLSHGKLNYGLEHVKTLLRSHNIFPSELGFDIITLATMVYLADTRIKAHSWSGFMDKRNCNSTSSVKC